MPNHESDRVILALEPSLLYSIPPLQILATSSFTKSSLRACESSQPAGMLSVDIQPLRYCLVSKVAKSDVVAHL